VRNVWRAPCPDPFSIIFCMFKIYNDSYAFGHTCPPNHTVRNVWRASPFDSVEPLGPLAWPLRPPRPPKDSRTVPPGDGLGRQRRLGMPSRPYSGMPTVTSAPPVGYLSVGGSAMHMKWPDDIGREAGIGRTRNWKELNVFRACPC